jgi:hypothetical protein
MALSQMQVDVAILYIFAQALAWSSAIAIGLVVGWSLKDEIGDWLKEFKPNQRKPEDDAK